jgi:DNA-binding protein H-NS
VAEWEYRKLYLNQHSPRGDELELLNAVGTEGWELVGINNNNIAYLKREVEEATLTTHTEEEARGQNAGPNGKAEARGRLAAMVKYRDAVTNDTWSGRGRMPNWLKRKQEAGEDIEEFLV